MSLVFGALSPHPPLLIPNIGKENISRVEKTKIAMEELEKDLYITQPDTIVIISPHGQIYPEIFTINAHPELNFDFKEFGDLVTIGKFTTDLSLIADIASAAKKTNKPVMLQSDSSLDYGSSVPLFYLTKHMSGVKIIPIGYSGLDLKKHFDFGYLLKEILMDTNKRVAVIASGDLSHRLSNNSPAGFSPSGKKFDEAILNSLQSGNTAGIINLDEKMIIEAGECGLKSLMILLGVLRNINYNLKILSYENPVGIGYLVAEFGID